MEADPQMIQMLELANNAFEITKINILRKQRKNESISKEAKFQQNWIYKNNQKDNLELKNTTFEINNSLHGFNSRLYSENEVGRLEYSSVKNIQTEARRKKMKEHSNKHT